MPEERFGIALSTILSISELGTGIGPFLLGGFIGIWGFSWLYLTVAVLTLFCGATYFLCRRNNYI